MKKESVGLGIAGFVLSLVSLVFVILFPLIGIILAIVSLILCIIQLREEKTGLAIAGLIISIVSIILNLLTLIAMIIVWNSVEDTLKKGNEAILKEKLSMLSNNYSN